MAVSFLYLSVYIVSHSLDGGCSRSSACDDGDLVCESGGHVECDVVAGVRCEVSKKP